MEQKYSPTTIEILKHLDGKTFEKISEIQTEINTIMLIKRRRAVKTALFQAKDLPEKISYEAARKLP